MKYYGLYPYIDVNWTNSRIYGQLMKKDDLLDYFLIAMLPYWRLSSNPQKWRYSPLAQLLGLLGIVRSNLWFKHNFVKHNFVIQYWGLLITMSIYIYMFPPPHSTHTGSKYLRATYSHRYMCYVSTSYFAIYIYMYIYISILIWIYIYTLMYIYICACIHF